jgi:hypothetical protein
VISKIAYSFCEFLNRLAIESLCFVRCWRQRQLHLAWQAQLADPLIIIFLLRSVFVFLSLLLWHRSWIDNLSLFPWRAIAIVNGEESGGGGNVRICFGRRFRNQSNTGLLTSSHMTVPPFPPHFQFLSSIKSRNKNWHWNRKTMAV